MAFDVIDDFDALSTPSEVVGRMSEALADFGYSGFLVATAPEVVGSARPSFLLNGWPTEWAEHYQRKNFYRDDPVVLHLRQTVDPFEWSEVPAELQVGERAAEIRQDAADFGLRKGFCVPVFQNGGVTAGVTMAGSKPDFDPYAKRAIHLIALYAHAKAASLAGRGERLKPRLLSQGEREVLVWLADGKSSWDISMILKISEATVNWRIKNAVTKLGAANRTNAVVRAMIAKEIIL